MLFLMIPSVTHRDESFLRKKFQKFVITQVICASKYGISKTTNILLVKSDMYWIGCTLKCIIFESHDTYRQKSKVIIKECSD